MSFAMKILANAVYFFPVSIVPDISCVKKRGVNQDYVEGMKRRKGRVTEDESSREYELRSCIEFGFLFHAFSLCLSHLIFLLS